MADLAVMPVTGNPFAAPALQPVAGDPWNGGAVAVDDYGRPISTTSSGSDLGTATDDRALKAVGATVGDIAGGIKDGVTYPSDVMAGKVDPYSQEGIGRALGSASLLAGGLAAPEEGAVGTMGGKVTSAATTEDPLAAIQAALDVHADITPATDAAAHPRSLPAGQLVQDAPAGHFMAFHGSPANFDAFDLAHLGTGEGTQVHGRGMYFAGDQDVAADYADTYGAPRTLPDGSTVNGHMYQVAIPGSPSDFFNQDVGLTEQSPAVRAAVAPLYDANGLTPDYQGSNLVYEMAQAARDSGVPFRNIDQHVTRQFADAGIPGHSYGGSGGSPNYVVFDPSGVKVMKTYAGGLPVPGSALTSSAATPRSLFESLMPGYVPAT